MDDWTEQAAFPMAGTMWNPGPADDRGYVPPDRSRPALDEETIASARGVPLLTVIGTVRDEAVPLRRSLHAWACQSTTLPVHPFPVRFLVLDDGSLDRPERVVAEFRGDLDVHLYRARSPGAPGERSCTVVFNAALRQVVRSPLVMAQWYDRIPGSVRHLQALLLPHTMLPGIATSAISRHIGASSSVADMAPAQLASVLATVPWEEDPERLEAIAGPIGAHCVPGQATESSGLVVPTAELVALGGWDERYGRTRHGYPNVDLFHRLLGSGLRVLFPPGVRAQNFHQTHPAGRREGKDTSLLADTTLARNGGPDGDWGRTPLERVA